MKRLALLVAILVAAPALGGCLESGPVAGGGDGGSGDAEARSDGLVLELDQDRDRIEPGETVRVNASVTNEGEDAVGYREGCRHEWSVAVEDDSGEEINWTRPVAMCEGFSWASLEAGETLTFPTADSQHPFPWNGTVWDGDEWVPAEDGDYRMVMSFEYTPEGSQDSSDLRKLNASVTVTVGSG